MEWVLRVLVGVVLAVAGAAKAFQPENFAVEVDRFQLTPWLLSVVLGYFLPWFEIVTAIALFFRPLYLGALLAVSGLGMLFAVAVGSAWWRGLDISCGCFGALVSGHVNAWHIFRRCFSSASEAHYSVYNGRLKKPLNELQATLALPYNEPELPLHLQVSLRFGISAAIHSRTGVPSSMCSLRMRRSLSALSAPYQIPSG